MKSHLLIPLCLLFLFVTSALSQTTLNSDIQNLQKQIQMWEAIVQNPNTPAGEQALNQRRLYDRRNELLGLLNRKISELQKFSLAKDISAIEKEDRNSSLQQMYALRSDLLMKLGGSGNQSVAVANTIRPREVAPSRILNHPRSSTTISTASTSSSLQNLNVVRSSNLPNTVPTPSVKVNAQRNVRSRGQNEEEKLFKIDAEKSVDTAQTDLTVTLTTADKWGRIFDVSVKSGGAEPRKSKLKIAPNETTGKTSIALSPGKNTVTVAAEQNSDLTNSVEIIYTPAAATATNGDGETSPRNTIHTRSIVGLENFAASSTTPQQKFFLDFNLNVPFGRGDSVDDSLDANFWLWANPRITSLPKPTAVDTKDIASSGNFFNPITTGKAGDITQGFEFLVGGEIPIIKPKDGMAIPSGFGEGIVGRIALSAIVGGGAITPFNPQATAVIFKVNQGIIDQYPDAKGKDFIAFIAEDRDRFFRQYFAGVRLKTYFFKKNAQGKDEVVDRFPGLFDITFGQNESVTGGRWRGGVLRLEGFYPMPFYPAVHVFGSALMKLTQRKISPSLILEGPSTIPPLSDPKVHLQTVPPVDRDYYRIGIGVDLLHLKKKSKPVAQ